MRVWLRLTHLFGLPDGYHPDPDNLMQAALGPVLRAAFQHVADAPLPDPIARLLQELALRETATQDRPQNAPLTPRPKPPARPRLRGVAALQRAGAVGVSRGDSEIQLCE